ncbi:hypothetical protein [Microcoleus sp. T2B6]|uniref:hypothetical protein n=1 Tax=Microcoleus sp. T2B6 TaxID=3055424 RepID=UPI002FD38DE6
MPSVCLPLFLKKEQSITAIIVWSGFKATREKILIKLWKVKAFEKVTTVGFFTQTAITTEIREVDQAKRPAK